MRWPLLGTRWSNWNQNPTFAKEKWEGSIINGSEAPLKGTNPTSSPRFGAFELSHALMLQVGSVSSL